MGDLAGKKYDAGKTPWSYAPWDALEAIVRVMAFGARKYGWNNWRELPNARERYGSAAIRHIIESIQGRQYDPESGLLTLAHAGCCIVFLIWFELHGYPAAVAPGDGTATDGPGRPSGPDAPG